MPVPRQVFWQQLVGLWYDCSGTSGCMVVTMGKACCRFFRLSGCCNNYIMYSYNTSIFSKLVFQLCIILYFTMNVNNFAMLTQ